jgi:hypothetical protein
MPSMSVLIASRQSHVYVHHVKHISTRPYMDLIFSSVDMPVVVVVVATEAAIVEEEVAGEATAEDTLVCAIHRVFICLFVCVCVVSSMWLCGITIVM